MELAAFVALRPALRVLGLAGAELAEVLGGPGDFVGEELHLYTAQRLSWYSVSGIEETSCDVRSVSRA